jgi:Flp pilus assembly protein TadD
LSIRPPRGTREQDSSSSTLDRAVANTGEHDQQEYRVRARALVGAIAEGTASERASALDALHALGQESGDVDVWVTYARGLAAAKRPADSVKVLEWLVNVVPSEPALHIELALAHAAIGNDQLARQGLEALLSEDVPDDVRVIATFRLAALGAPGFAVAVDPDVSELQRAALQERIASGQVTPDNAIRLTALAIERREEDPSGATLAEAAHVIEDALKRSPGHVQLLEHLVFVYTLTGDERADQALRELESVAPDSPVLAAFRDDEALQHDMQQVRSRLEQLVRTVATGNDQARAAALADLAAGVARFPADPEHRTTYAIALMISGREEEAVAQASVGAGLAGESHAMHYNIGQVFLRAGERERAHEHLRRAREYARDDRERADAEELLAQLDHG